MSKPIKITDEFRAAALREFAEALLRMRMTDGKISYSKPLENFTRRATVYFTPEAWMKMYMLVVNFDKEVAWHGVAKRSEDPEKDEYIISDILVYPQKVTAATVETDQEEYENWLYELPDEVFNNLRMQGHSHVNMGVSPSGVDTTHQEKIMRQLDDDMFYIFMIWNKSFTKWVKVYDFAKNTMFETADVDVKILDENWSLDEFLKDAKSSVKSGYTYGGNYGNYGSNGGYGTGAYGGAPVYGGKNKPTEPAKKEPSTPAQLPAKSDDNTDSTEKKTENAGRTSEKSGWESERNASRYAYDDDDDYGLDDDERFSGGYFNWGRYTSDPFYARGY